MKKILFTVFLLLAVSIFLSADVYIKTNVHTDAMANRPPSDMVMESWVGNNQLAIITGDKITILDMTKNMMFLVNAKDKSFVETSLPLDMSKLVLKEMAPMLAMMKITAKVTPNGKTQKIGKWNCGGYDIDMSVSMMQMKMKVWATTDVPFDWKAYNKMYSNMAKMKNMDDSSIAEFNKIVGYEVFSEMTMSIMGNNVKVTTQVEEITKKDAPANVYNVPAGFTKKGTLSLQDLRSGQ